MNHAKGSHTGHRLPILESLRLTFNDWIMEHFNLPADTSTLIVILALILLTWYIVNWVVRLLLSLMWPIAAIATIMVLWPYIRQGNFNDVVPNVARTAKDVACKMGIVFSQLTKRIVHCRTTS